MASQTQTGLLDQEYYEFQRDFISPRDPWKDDSLDGLARRDVYPYLKEKFDRLQKNDSLIQRLNGNEHEPPVLISIVRDRYGCWEALQVLLRSKKLDVDVLDRHGQPNGRTALSYAAGCHDAASMGLLLKYNANPDSKDESGLTPLMWMIERMQSFSSSVELPTKTTNIDGYMIKQFVEYARGMGIDGQDKKGQTALMMAAKKMRYDLIRNLISEKADFSKTDVEGHTWFSRLLTSRKRSRVTGSDTGHNDPVFKMVREIDILNMNTGGRTLLSWAVEFQDFVMVKALLEIGADANVYDEHTSDLVQRIPFLRALESNMKIAELFCREAWDLSIEDPEKDKYSLHKLCQYIRFVDETRALRLLGKMSELDYNMNKVGPDGKTPLHHVVGEGNERFALAILLSWKDGNDLNVMDNEGKTPLYYAMKNKITSVAKLLVQKGANIDLSLDWFWLGTDCVRFTLGSGNRRVEFITYPPDRQDRALESRLRDGPLINMSSCVDSTKLSYPHCTVTFLRREGITRPWRSLPNDNRNYTYHACSKIKKSLSGWTTSHIAVLLPNRNGMYETGNFWDIQCGSTSDGKQIDLITTIPSTTTPKSWNHLCEQLIEQLLESWESLCEEESNEMEEIREEQLRKEGKSRYMIKRLAENTLKRAKIRKWHQQQVSGLVRAFKSDANLDSSHKAEQIAKAEELREAVGTRLDHLEQLSKELLQIEFAWVSIREAGSIKRISVVTFIFLPLMFASSLFGMNINILADNPDWRWYVLIGAGSLILTMVIWILLGYFDDEHNVNGTRRKMFAFWENTTQIIKHPIDIKMRWSQHQEREMAEAYTTKSTV